MGRADINFQRCAENAFGRDSRWAFDLIQTDLFTNFEVLAWQRAVSLLLWLLGVLLSICGVLLSLIYSALVREGKQAVARITSIEETQRAFITATMIMTIELHPDHAAAISKAFQHFLDHEKKKNGEPNRWL